jgi:hypothetical protein
MSYEDDIRNASREGTRQGLEDYNYEQRMRAESDAYKAERARADEELLSRAWDAQGAYFTELNKKYGWHLSGEKIQIIGEYEEKLNYFRSQWGSSLSEDEIFTKLKKEEPKYIRAVTLEQIAATVAAVLLFLSIIAMIIIGFKTGHRFLGIINGVVVGLMLVTILIDLHLFTRILPILGILACVVMIGGYLFGIHIGHPFIAGDISSLFCFALFFLGTVSTETTETTKTTNRRIFEHAFITRTTNWHRYGVLSLKIMEDLRTEYHKIVNNN